MQFAVDLILVLENWYALCGVFDSHSAAAGMPACLKAAPRLAERGY
jgi:hypothetical protein